MGEEEKSNLYVYVYSDYEEDFIFKESKYTLADLHKLQQENQELKKQLEYLRSGEYINQLKFERNMLEDLLNKGEVSKEDKEFIDMTHRNTELLEQQKEFIEWLENEIEALEFCDNEFILSNHKKEVKAYKEILLKYKEIIGKDINVSIKGDDK